MAAGYKLTGAVLIFILICKRDLERHSKNRHAQASVVAFDVVVSDRKFQAIIYMEAVDAQVFAVENASLGHAVAFEAKYFLCDGDNGFAHEEIAEHAIAFKEPVNHYGRFAVVCRFDFHIAHFGKLGVGKDFIHAVTYFFTFFT